jgi:hypothetical protein
LPSVAPPKAQRKLQVAPLPVALPRVAPSTYQTTDAGLGAAWATKFTPVAVPDVTRTSVVGDGSSEVTTGAADSPGLGMVVTMRTERRMGPASQRTSDVTRL